MERKLTLRRGVAILVDALDSLAPATFERHDRWTDAEKEETSRFKGANDHGLFERIFIRRGLLR